jgi:hypothetical protein
LTVFDCPDFSEEEDMCIRFRLLALSMGLLAFLAPLSRAQNHADRIKTIQTNLNNAKQAFDQLPDNVKKVARAQRRLAHLSDAVNRMAPRLAKLTPGQQWSDDRNNEAPDENGLVRVTNPARDFRFTAWAGYTQDETAIARCGDNVVVGFNDTGSVLETLANGTSGISLSGVAASHDGGESFRDLGAMPPAGNGTNVFNADVLAGDPSVACSGPSNFYYAQTYFAFNPTTNQLENLVALSSSQDGGRTWGDPVAVVSPARDSLGFTLDFFGFSQVAVDPSNRKRVYMAYTRLHFFELVDPCQVASTIEVEASTDGGKTFGPPTIMASNCLGDIDLENIGTRLAVSSKGRVYVAWESDFTIPGIIGQQAQTVLVASFTPGSAPTPPVVVGTISCTNLFTGAFCASPVTPGMEAFFVLPFLGDTLDMQGEFNNRRDFDLTVDKSGGPTDGSVYVAFTTALGNALAPEAADGSTDHPGFYAFTDIFITRSADGQNFSPPSQLNSDLQPLDSRGHDHFQPTLAVDKTGKVGACWYDRRNDPENYQFERVCAESANAGSTWAEFRVNGTLSNPSTGRDLIALLDEMGLYDGLTTDFLGHAPGFIGSFQRTTGMNPDIVAFGFR